MPAWDTFTVQNVFTISGRGVALVGITGEQYHRWKIGIQVELTRPDGTSSVHTVVGVEYPPSIKWIGPRPPAPRYAVLVDSGLTRDAVPLGTEVRLVTVAYQLAKYATDLDFSRLDDATVHEVKRRLIDSLACALGAWRANAPNVARRIARRVTADPGANYLGGGTHRTSPDSLSTSQITRRMTTLRGAA